MSLLNPAALTRGVARCLKIAAVAATVVMVQGFESSQRIDEQIIKPMPRNFRLVVVDGGMSPTEAQFRRSGNTYVNEAPNTDGSSLMRASWFAVHKTDADAVLIEYPSVDATGNTVYRLEYALEEDRNRYRLFQINEDRLVAALDRLESAVRRGDASWGQRRRYEALTDIWNAHVGYRTSTPGDHFHVRDLDDVNALIDFSRRLDDGEKVITSNGDVVELYIR